MLPRRTPAGLPPAGRDRAFGMSADQQSAVRTGLAVAALKPCLMCGAAPATAAVFVPRDSGAFGARPGKQRLIFYSLCGECSEIATPEMIETAIERRGR